MPSVRIVLVAAILFTLAGAAQAADHVVRMKFDQATGRLYFDQARLVIQPGDTVTWIQADPVNEHNVVAYPDRIPEGASPFESPMMKKPGDKWSARFDREGTYEYHCHPHEAANMRGVLIVGRESRPGELRKIRPGEMRHEHGSGAADGHGHAGHGHAPGTPGHAH